jgi:hypothetical protein
MQPNEIIEYAKAYGHGMLDGFNEGAEDNSYPTPELRNAYAHGYEYGVFLYCEELEG